MKVTKINLTQTNTGTTAFPGTKGKTKMIQIHWVFFIHNIYFSLNDKRIEKYYKIIGLLHGSDLKGQLKM